MRFVFKGMLLILLFVLLVSPMQAQSGNYGTVPYRSKILVIGDSLTSGLYATHEQATFVSILGEMTGAKIGRRAAARLSNAVLVWNEVKAWNPDIVIIEVGLNDVAHRDAIDLSTWKSTYIGLVMSMQQAGKRVLICNTFWFGLQPSSPIYQPYVDYNEVIRQVAAETGATYVDIWSNTHNCDECVSTPEQLSYFNPHYHGDYFHPSDNGHKRIAETIKDALVSKTFFPFVSSQ